MALDTIRAHCQQLRLPTVAAVVGATLETAQREAWSLETFLTHLLEQELDGRQTRRITRLLKAAHLPPGKTLETFEQQRLPLRVRRQLAQLAAGEFIPRGDNVLLFGLPGTGKTQPC
ncbi:MAG: ATP-binding protein [Anaerolineae bacterium]|nr:ATP-binding protein [Anaerolineae bacterium]